MAKKQLIEEYAALSARVKEDDIIIGRLLEDNAKLREKNGRLLKENEELKETITTLSASSSTNQRAVL